MSEVAAVSARGLGHRYGERVALAGVDLDIAAGELVGVLGPNGSGKSTLFRVLSTLIEPQEGRVAIFGAGLGADPTGIRRRLGVVFQSPGLDRMLTAEENLRHQGHLYGLRGSALKRRIEICLGAVGIADLARRRTAEMSGGQRRRVELAKALLHEPGLLILDEPSTGLDPGARMEFREILRALQSAGTTVVLTTHLLDEAERCDRLVVLDRGRVIAADTPARLRGAVGGDVITVHFADETVAARHEAIWGGRFEAARVSRDGATVRAELPGAGCRMGEIIGMIGADAVSVTLSRPTLEDAFLDLTGRRFDA